jgi:hypothetical protein
MQTSEYQYWPFDAQSTVRDSAIKQTRFLESAFNLGYEAFTCGMNDYGARSAEREGLIIERGRTGRWEVCLADANDRALSAYVNDFTVAANAVKQWLSGKQVNEIVKLLQEHLITLPGAKASYTISAQHRNA